MNPKDRLKALLAQRDALRSEIVELDGIAEPTEENVSRYRAAIDEVDTLDTEITDLEGLVERAERAMQVRESSVANAERGGRAPEFMQTRSPYDDADAIRAGLIPVEDLRARAMTAIEDAPSHVADEGREFATGLLDDAQGRSGAAVAQHVLLTGSPEYHEEFREYVATRGSFIGPRMRAAMSLTGANGGYLVPFTLDPTIILTNDGAANPFRAVCDIKTITTDDWNGVTSAGVTAGWLAEGAEASDNTPTFGQPTIKAEKAAAWLFGSFESLSDSGFASEVGSLIADAKNNLEATAFATGSGSGQPTGIVTALVAGAKTVTSTTADTFAVADVYKVQTALPPRHRGKGVWFSNADIMAKIRQFDTAGGASFWANIGADVPEQLVGRSIYEASAMDGVINAGAENYVLAFIDPKTYAIVDRIGLTMMYEPLVKGANQRPTGQAGWFAYWRTGGNFTNVNGGRLLNVT